MVVNKRTSNVVLEISFGSNIFVAFTINENFNYVSPLEQMSRRLSITWWNVLYTTKDLTLSSFSMEMNAIIEDCFVAFKREDLYNEKTIHVE